MLVKTLKIFDGALVQYLKINCQGKKFDYMITGCHLELFLISEKDFVDEEKKDQRKFQLIA